jgi:hypothetical protein
VAVEFSAAATNTLVVARNIGKPAIGGAGRFVVDIDATVAQLGSGLYTACRSPKTFGSLVRTSASCGILTTDRQRGALI